jgi:predicted dehydrogenase
MVARYHAQAIAATPGARLVAVCRRDASRCAEAAAEFGVPCEDNEQAVLARSDVDAVCVASPSGRHAAQVVAAARAGKHVLVEKPLALSLADADAMIAACRTAGVRLGVALQRRTEPCYQALRAAIEAGELGRLVLGTTTVPYFRAQAYYDSADWRGTRSLDGGGALMNQGIHLADLLLWMMGDAEEVCAYAATLARSVEVEDCLSASVRFRSGALGSVLATTAASPGFPHRVEVYGTAGGVQIEGERVVQWATGIQTLPTEATPQPPAAAGAGSSPTGIGATAHTRILADFVAAIREARPPMITGEEARRSLAFVLAIYESARTGRPVRLAAERAA